jgi:hypothetical protein
MYREQGQTVVRRIQGLLSFLKKYGVARVDEACAMALEMGVSDFRFVRRFLERNLGPAPDLTQVNPLIRQLTLYRDANGGHTAEAELSAVGRTGS